MGTGKKEAVRKQREGKSGNGMGNVKTKGENFYRNAKQAKQARIENSGKAQRNAAGDITRAAKYQSREVKVARIEPNRKWFGNTRVIAQNSLTQFREAIAKTTSDPYSVLLKSNKLPLSLVRDDTTKNGIKQHQAKIAVEQTPFGKTFGPKAQRKRVKLDVSSMDELSQHSNKAHNNFLDHPEAGGDEGGNEMRQNGVEKEGDGSYDTAKEAIFSKGQSKRIWNELYKVIDSSDVVIHVLDARDPEVVMGTRCRSVEKYIKEEAPHKHLIFLLNKCDLIPTSAAASWVRSLSKEYPCLAFHASITNSFGKGSLISILRQFSSLHSNRKQISVGFIGYPNTGKSSIINTLLWQYITLMKRIYLIDCPGIVPPSSNETDEDILLKGVVRVENVENAGQYVGAVLRKCRPQHITRTYDMDDYSDATDFLEKLARKSGRLLKGGEADVDGVAKMVLNDFLRGKIPWFTAPPAQEEQPASEKHERGNLGDMTRLNKLPTADLRSRKRKREGEEGSTKAPKRIGLDS